MKNPPDKFIKSVQLELFSQFITNNKYGVSNTVEIWEKIPKYFFTPKQVKNLRTSDGLAKPFEWSYTDTDNRETYTIRIQPALIQEEKCFLLNFFVFIDLFTKLADIYREISFKELKEMFL